MDREEDDVDVGEGTELLVDSEQRRKESEHLLQILQRRPQRSLKAKDDEIDGIDKDEHSGFLFKKTRANGWNKYWFQFRPSIMELHYFRTKEDSFKKKNPRGIVGISWVTLRTTKVEDKLMHTQLKKTNGVCKYRLRVLSSKRLYTLSAESDEDMEVWTKRIEKALHASLSPDEITEKKKAASELEPHLQNQLKLQMQHYALVVRALQQAGLFSTKISGKQKEGYLGILKGPNFYKKYYFVLFKHSLAYFSLTDKTIPRNVISLNAISYIRSISDLSEEFSHLGVEDAFPTDEGKGAVFVICTPIRTFHLLAKHEEAMKDWIVSIQHLLKGTLPTLDVRCDDDIEGRQVSFKIGEKILLEYHVQGKKKVYKMKKRNILIGRSSKSDLTLEKDKKISRNHARIELNSKDVPVLYDLGSVAGSLKNGEVINRTALKSGDKILLGDTEIIFKVRDATNSTVRLDRALSM